MAASMALCRDSGFNSKLSKRSVVALSTPLRVDAGPVCAA